MTNEALLDQQTQKIIKRYMVLYKLIFQYSIFFIPLLLGAIWAWSLQSSKVTARYYPNKETKFLSYTNTGGIYKAARVSDQVGPIMNDLGYIKILGGELQATGNVLIGRNNLITLGGIFLPNRPYIIDFSFTGSIGTFEQKEYNTNTLKRVLDNWILSVSPENNTTGVTIDTMFFKQQDPSKLMQTNMEQVLEILKSRAYFNPTIQYIDPTLASNSANIQKVSFIKDFNLSCINKRKGYKGFCDVNISRFIERLPDLQLDGGWADIVTIASKISRPDHIANFCSNIMSNILKNPYPNLELDRIMGGVCSAYNNRYSTIKDFLKVQNELDVITSEEVVSNNIDANLFKLVSLWQKIVSQNRKKSLDTTNVVAYLRFVDGLIHQNNMTVPQFYIDGAYYFNNVYLKNILKTLTTSSIDPSVKNEIGTLLDTISSLNKGNASIGVKGLEKMVINQNILKDINNLPSNYFNSIANFQQVFDDTLKLYPEIRSNESQVDETTKKARVVGNLEFFDEDKKEKNVQIIINFDYKGNSFELASVRTPQNPVMDTIIGTYISKNPNTTLGTILEIIKSNNDYIKTVLTICDSINLQKGIQVVECTPNKATISIGSNTSTINVVFTIVNDRITKASTTNKDIQAYLDKTLNTNTISRDTIGAVITNIVAIATPKKPVDPTDEISSIDSQKLAIIAKFKKFLNTEPTDIVQKNGKWIVAFTLNKYEFASIVDIAKNYKLAPLVVQIGGQIITVKEFSLALIPFSQNRISQFLDDPLAFIKQVDTKAYDAIIKAGGDNK